MTLLNVHQDKDNNNKDTLVCKGVWLRCVVCGSRKYKIIILYYKKLCENGEREKKKTKKRKKKETTVL